MTLYDARDDSSLEQACSLLGNTGFLMDFLPGNDTLDVDQKKLVIDQARLLLSQFYANLPIKKASYAIDPDQRLRILRQRVGDMRDQSFHTEMLEIFKSLRDAHTNYGLPRSYHGRFAFLPFMMKVYFENDVRRFLLTNVLFKFQHPLFKPGVEITHWNGTPIERAVMINAEREEGSNEAARFSFGLTSMTVKNLRFSLPPSEEWVIVTFKRDNGEKDDILLPWRIWDTRAEKRPDLRSDFEMSDTPDAGDMATLISLCVRVQQSHMVRKHLFAHSVVELTQRVTQVRERFSIGCEAIGTASFSGLDQLGVDTNMVSILPDVLQFSVVRYDDVPYGYIRIRTFDHSNVNQFINEFIRILSMMPENGLIIDVRDNGGGRILNSEYLLQLLTPHRITPEPVQFISTPLTLELCRKPVRAVDQSTSDRLGIPLDKLREFATLRSHLADIWSDSLEQSVQTGATFSKALPLSDPGDANALGQRYHGPVALITNAQCYSATDIFIAGFRDHAIGTIVGVDENTGAGGANVFTHDGLLVPLLPEESSPIKPLPDGVMMRVAIRRCLRVGPNAGQPLENLGVRPDLHHQLTKRDILEGDVDLLKRCAGILSNLPVYQLELVQDDIQKTVISLKLKTRSLDRLDIFIDERPMATFNISDGENDLSIPVYDVPSSLDIRGYANGRYVAARKLSFLMKEG